MESKVYSVVRCVKVCIKTISHDTVSYGDIVESVRKSVKYTHTTISVGIFGYLNYLQPRTRQYILEALVKGLQRLEYRGYDSAGVAFDSDVQVDHVAQNLLQTV